MKSGPAIMLAFSYLEKQKAKLASAIFWRMLRELIPMQVPVLTGMIIDSLASNHISVYGVIHTIKDPLVLLQITAGGLLMVAMLEGFSSYMCMISASRLSRHFVGQLRKKLFDKVTILSLDQHHRFGAGDLLDRTLRDTDATRLFMERVFIQVITNVLRAGYPIVMLFFIDVRLTFLVLSVIPVQWLLSRFLEKKLYRVIKQSRETDSELISSVKENLDGIETIQTLNVESQLLSKLHRRSDKLENEQLRTSHLTALVSGNIWLMTSIGIALTWWQGGIRVLSGDMTLGTLVIFSGLVAFAYRPFRQFTNILKAYRCGLVSLERIRDLLHAQILISSPHDAKPLIISKGKITFENVSLSYDNFPTLKEIDLTIAPQEFTAIVGRSGSGKSSLLRLLVRLYDPGKGRICIDGQDIAHVTLNSLRSQIAVVPQKPMLFHGTLYDNITMARQDASLEEVENACRSAWAWEFIQQMDNDLDTVVGSDGTYLSGGEIQRIAIARALLSQPRILLMDEPTSALDSESEMAIMKSLLQLRRKMTVVIVAHRPNTIRFADRIVLMDDGAIVATGSSDSLLGSSEIYQELFIKTESILIT